jgi:hypothetical protein
MSSRGLQRGSLLANFKPTKMCFHAMQAGDQLNKKKKALLPAVVRRIASAGAPSAGLSGR